MGRLSTQSFSAVALSQVADLFETQPAAGKQLTLRRVVVTFDDSETNQQVKFTLTRFSGAFTSGSGGSTVIPVLLNSHDTAPAYVAKVCNTTRCTGGTSVLIQPEGFPSQGGYEFRPDVDERPVFYNGEAFVLGIEESPAAAKLSGFILWEEA